MFFLHFPYWVGFGSIMKVLDSVKATANFREGPSLICKSYLFCFWKEYQRLLSLDYYLGIFAVTHDLTF